MSLVLELKVGSKIEIAHGKWKKCYMVTTIGVCGHAILQRCCYPKSKADRGRFPEFITLALKKALA